MTVLRELQLRLHQETAVENCREQFRQHMRRVLLVAPTSFGKTESSIAIIRSAMEKGNRVLFIVDRIMLIDQTDDRFASYGIDAGVLQASHPRTAPDKLVQIASVQTLARRTLRHAPDLIIWDECHCVYDSVLKLIARYPRARVVGLTATPFTAGMAEHWDGFVNGATVNYLLGANPTGERFLTPLKVKACVEPDMKGAKKRAGEYADEEAGERGIVIIGNVVQTWLEQTRRHFGGPVKTIVFSPSVKHGDEFCRQMADAGFNFQQISYLDASDDDRRAKIEEFRRPDSAIHGLVSCAVLTKGFDVPDVLCGISCRPYRKSLSSHIQEMGRVMRLSPETGKTFGLWLCHSGNAVTFAGETAALFEYGVESLSDAVKRDSQTREKPERTKTERFCSGCGMQMEPRAERCGDCGWERPKRGEIQIRSGDLIDLDMRVASTFTPRSGLRAACLEDPGRIWNAALAYCLSKGRRGDDAARKWAFGIWRGIYPGARLPHGLYAAPCSPDAVGVEEWQLVEREVSRFRKGGAGRRRAA